MDTNRISAQNLQDEIEKINKKTEKLREQSNSTYHKAIEDVMKQAIVDREKSLKKAKTDIEKMNQDSEKKVSDLIKKSKPDYGKAAKSIADSFVKKLFGTSSSMKDSVKVAMDKFE